MTPNPALTSLGFAADDRVVILHADDVGMCQATIPAAVELTSIGTVTSASVMVPCPWAEEATRTLLDHGADVGVHWTLTAEWPRYRWSPVTYADDLRDDAGRLPATVAAIQGRASTSSVTAELAAQLDIAQAWGEISHVDSHMGAIANAAWLPGAIEVALSRGVVPFLPRFDAAAWRTVGLDADGAHAAEAFVRAMADRGVPMVDHIRSLPLEHADDHRGHLLAVLDDLPPGLTHLYCHPAIDTPELRAIANDWAARVANYEALRSDGLLDEIARRGVTLLPYAAFRPQVVR